MIRENQAIRANLRIDSRESGHLRCNTFENEFPHQFLVEVDFLRCLEDCHLLKLGSLDSSFPFFLSDTSIWGE